MRVCACLYRSLGFTHRLQKQKNCWQRCDFITAWTFFHLFFFSLTNRNLTIDPWQVTSIFDIKSSFTKTTPTPHLSALPLPFFHLTMSFFFFFPMTDMLLNSQMVSTCFPYVDLPPTHANKSTKLHLRFHRLVNQCHCHFSNCFLCFAAHQ